MDEVNLRAKRRAEEASQRADELRRRYRELAVWPGSDPERVQHARRAALAAATHAAEALRHLLELLDRSAAIHQLAAHAHDRAAGAAHDDKERTGHTRAAERHRGVASDYRLAAAQLRENKSALPKQHRETTPAAGFQTQIRGYVSGHAKFSE